MRICGKRKRAEHTRTNGGPIVLHGTPFLSKANAVCDTDALPLNLRRLPFYLTWIAVVAPLCSITASNWAIAAAFAALVIGHFRHGDPFRFPKVKLPLAVFFLCTTVSIALSGHALEGWEGIRKFYLCLVLLLVASTFRGPRDVRTLVFGLSGVTAVSAAWSLVQFARKLGEANAAGRDFRLSYTAGERITGFMSHWMTLSGEEMMVLLMLAALAMFGSKGRLRWLLAA